MYECRLTHDENMLLFVARENESLTYPLYLPAIPFANPNTEPQLKSKAFNSSGSLTLVRRIYSLHKVLMYIEHHSVCPLVGIGTPPPR